MSVYIFGEVDFSIPMKDNTFLFVGSVATTIGFGNVTPKTQPGQVICIVFAVIRKIFREKLTIFWTRNEKQ